jgi:hypothetical protein
VLCFEVGYGIEVLVQVHVASAEVSLRLAFPRPATHLLFSRQVLRVVLGRESGEAFARVSFFVCVLQCVCARTCACVSQCAHVYATYTHAHSFSHIRVCVCV